MNDYYTEKINQELFKLQDENYKKFNQKLIPNIKSETFIGIRIPLLKELSKKIEQENPKMSEEFLNKLPHKYFEENQLHSFLIGNVKDFETSIILTELFLPYIDNWAVCDSFSPKIFKKYSTEVYNKIKIWLNSKQTYTVRFAVGLLLSNYLDKNFEEEMLNLVSKIKSDEYYVNMMIAWYFATALVKQYDSTIPYITNKTLDPWVHNKTIQKAIESRRFSDEQKKYFKTLKNL